MGLVVYIFTIFTVLRLRRSERYVVRASDAFLDRVDWSNPQAAVQIGYAVRPWVDGVYDGLRFVRAERGKYGQKFRSTARSSVEPFGGEAAPGGRRRMGMVSAFVPRERGTSLVASTLAVYGVKNGAPKKFWVL